MGKIRVPTLLRSVSRRSRLLAAGIQRSREPTRLAIEIDEDRAPGGTGKLAESLLATIKTVETHLRSAYHKPEISSRSELLAKLSDDWIAVRRPSLRCGKRKAAPHAALCTAARLSAPWISS